MIRPQLEEFMRRMDQKSVAIIPAAREATRSNDTQYRFRQDSDFYYLTGFEEPEAIAVIAPASEHKYTLFVRPRDPEQEIWVGRRAGVEGAKSEFGAQESFPITDFEEKLQDLLDGAEKLYYRLGVNSDDGFEVTAVAPQGVSGSSIVLGLFDNGRAAADTLFDFSLQFDPDLQRMQKSIFLLSLFIEEIKSTP